MAQKAYLPSKTICFYCVVKQASSVFSAFYFFPITAITNPMPLEVTHWAATAYQSFNRSLDFMIWNLFLAVIPWVLSLWLFRSAKSAKRGVLWWLGVAVFVAFLPNAPYILTDVIHLVDFIRKGAAMWTIVFILIPQYFVFMLLGTEAYVLSLINLGRYLKEQKKPHWIKPTEWVLHALCAFGIYLGRVPRFNSWELLTNPGQIVSFIAKDIWQPPAAAAMLVTFVTLVGVYWLLKHLSLAVLLYLRTIREEPSADGS